MVTSGGKSALWTERGRAGVHTAGNASFLVVVTQLSPLHECIKLYICYAFFFMEWHHHNSKDIKATTKVLMLGPHPRPMKRTLGVEGVASGSFKHSKVTVMQLKGWEALVPWTEGSTGSPVCVLNFNALPFSPCLCASVSSSVKWVQKHRYPWRV